MTRSGDEAGSDAIAALVGRMKTEPSRTWSVIVTFIGDAIVPRGGSVWLGTLLAFFEALDVNAPVVRTAVSRLTSDDWLDRTRVGRNSFYRLSKRGVAAFEQAAAHVYSRIEIEPEGRLRFALLKPDGDRDAARAAMRQSGFAPLNGDLWLSVRGAGLSRSDVITFSGEATPENGRALARACWPIDDLEARYTAFLQAFLPLDEALATRRDVSPRDAIVARTLLIHEYRRVALRDPRLPASLLPATWPARQAAELCGRLYLKLLPRAESWLDENGECEAGALPEASTALAARFAVPPKIYNRNS